jgi:hypothetical protein
VDNFFPWFLFCDRYVVAESDHNVTVESTHLWTGPVPRFYFTFWGLILF